MREREIERVIDRDKEKGNDRDRVRETETERLTLTKISRKPHFGHICHFSVLWNLNLIC